MRLVGAGNHLVVVVVNQDKHYKLYYFDQYARRVEIQLEDSSVLPTALAVSRDDSKIAICCGATVFVYEVTIHAARLMGSVPAHSRGSNLPANRRLQQANFSLDSTRLVTATQEYHGTEKSPYQVHVSLWRCLPLSVPVLEVELDPVVLDLVSSSFVRREGVLSNISNIGIHVHRATATTPASPAYSAPSTTPTQKTRGCFSQPKRQRYTTASSCLQRTTRTSV